MEYRDLKLRVGESLQLQPRDGEEGRRMHVRVIGYVPGKSLLVTTPQVGGKVMIIREGQPFVVRMLVGNKVVGFATQVLRSCAVPYPYLHLSYPDEMEQIIVRKAQRVRVKLFASVKNCNPDLQSDKGVSVTVSDISISGAMVMSGKQFGEVGDEVLLTCAIKIAGAEKLLSIPAVVRNINVEQDEEEGVDRFYHGLEFNIKDQQDTFALHGYVYEQIVKAQTE